MKKIGLKIRLLRDANGHSQEYMAEKINIGQTTLSRIETGKSRIDLETLEKIADFLNVSLLDLISEDRVIIYKVSEHQSGGNGVVIHQNNTSDSNQLESKIKNMEEKLEKIMSKFKE